MINFLLGLFMGIWIPIIISLVFVAKDTDEAFERRWNNEQRIEKDKSHFDKTRPNTGAEVSSVSK